MRSAAFAAFFLVCCAPAHPPATHAEHRADDRVMRIERRDATVESDPGIRIAVREVVAVGGSAPRRVPVILVHGLGGGGVTSFDSPVAGYSLAEDLARAGHAVIVLDVRGWERSTRPPALEAPAAVNPPAVPSEEAVRDIGAVVASVRAREHGPVALFGWATGGHWVGMYAATHPDAVSHIVLLNTIYGTPGAWPMRAMLEDSDRPGEFARSLGAYNARDTRSMLRSWDAAIPAADKTSWRDPQVAEAYASGAVASDPTSSQRTPPSVRLPNGPLRDSYLLAGGTKFWRAGDIRSATLLVRSELDHWSRPEDVAALQRELGHARRVETRMLPQATHFVFLDRPEHGRREFVDAVEKFLAQP
ncbi:alpha/beta hydrolase [Pendulispora rubella]|uniref:Alpha/beta hydrolase n=1 Tax=Pendulispora rubella TaxID=2741070 RepID=A0ABZ2KTV8_9BACT